MSAVQQVPGALAGALGTLALSALEPVRDALLGHAPPYSVRALVTRGLRHHGGPRLSARQAQGLGLAMRWVYGPMIGWVYAGLRSRLPASARLGGLTLGASVGLFERIAFPLLHVTPPPRTWSRGEKVLLGLQVLLFGVVTEAILARRVSLYRAPGREA